MASGRKSRSSRHRSYKHSQKEKLGDGVNSRDDESADLIEPFPAMPWVESPGCLDSDNVGLPASKSKRKPNDTDPDKDSHNAYRASSKRKKEDSGSSPTLFDRWDGGDTDFDIADGDGAFGLPVESITESKGGAHAKIAREKVRSNSEYQLIHAHSSNVSGSSKTSSRKGDGTKRRDEDVVEKGLSLAAPGFNLSDGNSALERVFDMTEGDGAFSLPVESIRESKGGAHAKSQKGKLKGTVTPVLCQLDRDLDTGAKNKGSRDRDSTDSIAREKVRSYSDYQLIHAHSSNISGSSKTSSRKGDGTKRRDKDVVEKGLSSEAPGFNLSDGNSALKRVKPVDQRKSASPEHQKAEQLQMSQKYQETHESRKSENCDTMSRECIEAIGPTRNNPTKDIAGVHWVLKDENRNYELEKELEERIRRRRDEYVHRDKWEDGMKEKEGKLYQRDNKEDTLRATVKHQDAKVIEERLKDGRPKVEDIKHRDSNDKGVRDLDNYKLGKSSEEGTDLHDINQRCKDGKEEVKKHAIDKICKTLFEEHKEQIYAEGHFIEQGEKEKKSKGEDRRSKRIDQKIQDNIIKDQRERGVDQKIQDNIIKDQRDREDLHMADKDMNRDEKFKDAIVKGKRDKLEHFKVGKSLHEMETQRKLRVEGETKHANEHLKVEERRHINILGMDELSRHEVHKTDKVQEEDIKNVMFQEIQSIANQLSNKDRNNRSKRDKDKGDVGKLDADKHTESRSMKDNLRERKESDVRISSSLGKDNMHGRLEDPVDKYERFTDCKNKYERHKNEDHDKPVMGDKYISYKDVKRKHEKLTDVQNKLEKDDRYNDKKQVERETAHRWREGRKDVKSERPVERYEGRYPTWRGIRDSDGRYKARERHDEELHLENEQGNPQVKHAPSSRECTTSISIQSEHNSKAVGDNHSCKPALDDPDETSARKNEGDGKQSRNTERIGGHYGELEDNCANKEGEFSLNAKVSVSGKRRSESPHYDVGITLPHKQFDSSSSLVDDSCGSPLQSLVDGSHYPVCEISPNRHEIDASISVGSTDRNSSQRERKLELAENTGGNPVAGREQGIITREPKDLDLDLVNDSERISPDWIFDPLTAPGLSSAGLDKCVVKEEPVCEDNLMTEHSHHTVLSQLEALPEDQKKNTMPHKILERSEPGLLMCRPFESSTGISKPAAHPERPSSLRPHSPAFWIGGGENPVDHNNMLEEGLVSREDLRHERKSVFGYKCGEMGGASEPNMAWRDLGRGCWNAQNQGSHPGNTFHPFPPQVGGCPSSFHGMRQQFGMPRLFGSSDCSRPGSEFGFPGFGFHRGDAGFGFSNHQHLAGRYRHGEFPDSYQPPFQARMCTWVGEASYSEEYHRYGVKGWSEHASRQSRDVWHQGLDADQNLNANDNMASVSTHSQNKTSSQQPSIETDVKPKPSKKLPRVLEGSGTPDSRQASIKDVLDKNMTVDRSKPDKRFLLKKQALLSDLCISDHMAGPALYNRCRTLLPSSNARKMDILPIRDFNETLSDDELEFDVEAKALISTQPTISELLPPLPESVFQESLNIYQRVENRLQKSAMGSFVLPSGISLPEIFKNADSQLQSIPDNNSSLTCMDTSGVGACVHSSEVDANKGVESKESFVRDCNVCDDKRQLHAINPMEARNCSDDNLLEDSQVSAPRYRIQDIESDLTETLQNNNSECISCSKFEAEMKMPEMDDEVAAGIMQILNKEDFKSETLQNISGSDVCNMFEAKISVTQELATTMHALNPKFQPVSSAACAHGKAVVSDMCPSLDFSNVSAYMSVMTTQANVEVVAAMGLELSKHTGEHVVAHISVDNGHMDLDLASKDLSSVTDVVNGCYCVIEPCSHKTVARPCEPLKDIFPCSGERVKNGYNYNHMHSREFPWAKAVFNKKNGRTGMDGFRDMCKPQPSPREACERIL